MSIESQRDGGKESTVNEMRLSFTCGSGKPVKGRHKETETKREREREREKEAN
jgi:hypothetical protein